MQVGDIILVHSGKSISARGISIIMKHHIKRAHLLEYNPKLKPYHHAGTIVDFEGELCVAEARADGWAVTPLDEAYDNEAWASRIDVYTPVEPYSAYERYIISKAAIEYSLDITRYDYMNFIWWLYYYGTGLWIGKNNNRLYCSEGVAMLANYVRAYTFDNPQRTNPVDIAINKNFRIV